MKNKLDEFIKRAKIIHSDKYDYSMVEYVTSRTNVIIICKIHGEFHQRPNSHISQKAGCPQCSGSLKLTTEQFIKNANIVHSNKYNYLKVNYVNANTKVIVTCPDHGDFKIIAKFHTHYKLGCRQCSTRQYLTNDEYIYQANIIHNNIYNYDKVDFKNMIDKIIITCPEHGDFLQKAGNHIYPSLKHGCPICKLSKGEIRIKKFLEDNNFKFKREKSFDNCRDKSLLKFDFYLLEYNSCIEYDGMQHFQTSNYFFGDEKTLKNTQRRDKIKTEYCKNNNIKLIRIKYTDYNKIDDILKKELYNEQKILCL